MSGDLLAPGWQVALAAGGLARLALVVRDDAEPAAAKVPPRAPFGYRFGSEEGPWQRPSGVSAAERALVPCMAEQHLLRRIMERMGSPELQSQAHGSRAYVVARELTSAGILHPRTGGPWRAGSLVNIHATAQRRADEVAMAVIADAVAL